MKEDYLWDKTGAADPEIERLEKALAVFRYRADEPPALPAKIIPFERNNPRRFFRFGFAFAACAALVIISLGALFQFSGGKAEVAKDSKETNPSPVVEEVADETPVTQPNDSITRKVETPKRSVERSFVKAKKSAPVIDRQNKLFARNVEIKKPAVRLTKEEKYAYDQLMLALSVTSSTFKKVKNKVEGVEDVTAARGKSGR